MEIKYTDEEYSHLLKLLIAGNHTNGAIAWLEHLEERSIDLNFLLGLAIAANNIKIVEKILRHKKKINLEYHNNLFFKIACMMGYYDIIMSLVNAGTNIKSVIDDCLALAASNGHENIVRLLLELSANISFKNNHATKWAYQNNHTDTVKLLLDNGASSENLDEYCSQNNHRVILCELKTVTFRITEIIYDKHGYPSKSWVEFA